MLVWVLWCEVTPWAVLLSWRRWCFRARSCTGLFSLCTPARMMWLCRGLAFGELRSKSGLAHELARTYGCLPVCPSAQGGCRLRLCPSIPGPPWQLCAVALQQHWDAPGGICSLDCGSQPWLPITALDPGRRAAACTS